MARVMAKVKSVGPFALRAATYGQVIKSIDYLRLFWYDVPESEVERVVAELGHDPLVEYACREPNIKAPYRHPDGLVVVRPH